MTALRNLGLAFVLLLLPPTLALADESPYPIRGAAAAKITIEEFADFQCPYCQRAKGTLDELLQIYEGEVRLIYRHFPLPFHAEARPAALATICAQKQGKFWELHDRIFAEQASLSQASLQQWAVDLGLDAPAFNTCLSSTEAATRLQADIDEGKARGVSGTPTFFINGEKVVGAIGLDEFRAIIDKLR